MPLSRSVAPYAGAWIEIVPSLYCLNLSAVAPYAGAWIEIYQSWRGHASNGSHPTRVRGLK